MESVLERLPSGARVSIVRLRSLGDCVLTTPALELLKRHRPDLEITIVVEDRFRAIFETNPDVNLTVPPRLSRIANSGTDLCINLHGGTRSALLTLASVARFRAGFAHYRVQTPYNVHIPRAQEILQVDRKVHTAEHLASAMFHLGVPITEIPPARLFTDSPNPQRPPYAVLHPFASTPEKTWPAERFVQLGNHLRQAGLTPVILAGPVDDASEFTKFEVRRNALLPDVIAMLKSAALFVGNDSGPAHMAAACRTPLVVLFADSDPVIWAPWKTTVSEQIIRPRMADIRLDDTLAAVESLGVRA
jgi:heptosyltransferase III